MRSCLCGSVQLIIVFVLRLFLVPRQEVAEVVKVFQEVALLTFFFFSGCEHLTSRA